MMWVLIYLTVAVLVSTLAHVVMDARLWYFLERPEVMFLAVAIGLLWPVAVPVGLFVLAVTLLARGVEEPVRSLIEYILKNR